MSRSPHRPWALLAALLATAATVTAQDVPKPERAEATWPGLKPSGEVLLPNGWSLKPAGRSTALGDFPILLAECPTEPVMAVLHAGYGVHEVVTLDLKSGQIVGRVTIPETFGGLVWTRDGKTLYVGGGHDDVVYGFDHAGGLLSNRSSIPLSVGERGERLPAGLALGNDEKTIWVTNAFGHSVTRLDRETGRVEAEIPTGKDSYPYGVAVDDQRGRVYVSLWNGARVAIIDAGTNAITGHLATEEHPNELLLARGGRFCTPPTPTAIPCR